MNARIQEARLRSRVEVARLLDKWCLIETTLAEVYLRSEELLSVRAIIEQEAGAWLVDGEIRQIEGWPAQIHPVYELTDCDGSGKCSQTVIGISEIDYCRLEREILRGKHLLTRLFLSAPPLSVVRREICQSSVYSPRKSKVRGDAVVALYEEVMRFSKQNLEQQGKEFP